MALMTSEERLLAAAAAEMPYTNPFLPAWVDCEKRALGEAFIDHGVVWSARADVPPIRDNLVAIGGRMTELSDRLLVRMAKGARPNGEESELYENMVIFMLYERFAERMLALGLETEQGGLKLRRVAFYREFAEAARKYLSVAGRESETLAELPRLFALFFQVRRAFHHIFTFIVGGSMPTARLRAAVWQSIFTHDMRRYRRSLYARMGELTTLITGPSGTGKELVARAIGMARYIPFDEKSCRFAEDFAGTFYPLDLSALSPTLIESELFGHRKGAFTGALVDRSGWLELCTPLGAVFLDEIGDVSLEIQVKLLRVLETRRFQRLGESSPRTFEGKIIAATNRDLCAEIAAGRFRHDLYYRLCADTVRTPGLAEQIADSPGELENLVRHLALQIAGESEAEPLTAEVMALIRDDLGVDYAWPGNIRELAQCVRNVLVRREYRPSEQACAPSSARERFLREVGAGDLSAEELLSKYTTLVYAAAGTYEETARRLGLDRRTVKSRIDAELLEQFRSVAEGG
jgi:transcriptional regulator with AAA-type ATPase domain